jgi:O-antigen/teichoic acid export membrane protein
MNSIFNFLNSEDGTIRKRAVRSVSWVGITGILLNILLLIRGIVLARLMTPEIFGLMSICLVVIRGFEIFTETGFYTELVQRQNNYEEAKKTAFTLMVIRGILLAAVTFMISPLVAQYYNEDVLEFALKVISVSFVFSGFYNVNTVNLQRDLNFKRLSYLEQAQGIINFVFVIAFAYYFRNVWALVLGHVIASLMGSILSFVFIPSKPKIGLNLAIAKELYHYGKFITGLSVVIFITIEIGNIIIGKILGMEALGYYVLAFALANMPATQISKVISKVLFPAYSALKNNNTALQDAFLKSLKVISYITIPAAAGIAVLAPEIVRVVYGEKWMPAVSSLQILSLFGCIRSIGAITGYLYNAIGKPSIGFYMNFMKLALILVIIIPLITKFEIVGASLAVTVPTCIQFFASLFILRKVIGVGIMKVLNTLFVPSIYSIIMCMVIILARRCFNVVNVTELSLLMTIGMIVYFTLGRREILLNIRELKAATR